VLALVLAPVLASVLMLVLAPVPVLVLLLASDRPVVPCLSSAAAPSGCGSWSSMPPSPSFFGSARDYLHADIYFEIDVRVGGI